MGINSDIIWLYSGSGSFSNTSGSLGGAISNNTIPSGVNANLFPNVDRADALAGLTQYMCLYIQNSSLTVTYTGIGIYFETNTADSTASAFYLCPGTSGIDSAEQSIVNTTTEPTGVIWQNPQYSYTAVALPSLASGDYKAIWLQRQIIAGCPGIVKDFVRLRLISDQG